MLKAIKHVFLVSLGVMAAIAGYLYWQYSERYVSTDDAYVNANVVQIAPRVTGQVAHLYVKNNQQVKKGDPLFDIDDAPFRVAIEKAKAQLSVDQANWEDAQVSAKRITSLVEQKTLPPQQGDDAVAKLKDTIAMIAVDKATLDQAQLNLTYTHIVAPTDGWVTNMSLRENDLVDTNQPVFAFISDREFWVDANFKETDLERIKEGQIAKIVCDMYPHHQFKGVVESISGGSGNAFSLLPPQNATGNWVKITQRVPVRVRVMELDPKYPLRIGTSATVTIDTYSARK